MARKYRCRPSDILKLEDDYAAYCLDEACVYILGCLEEGKRPFFRAGEGAPARNGNAATVELLKQLGAEVRMA